MRSRVSNLVCVAYGYANAHKLLSAAVRVAKGYGEVRTLAGEKVKG